MGQKLVREVLAMDGCDLSGGTERTSHHALGHDITAAAGLEPCGIRIREDAPALFLASDVIIDFTTAEITQKHTALAVQHDTKLILGTTGHDEEQIASIECTPLRDCLCFC